MLVLIPLLILTATALFVYGGFVKLAARLLGYTVTWKASFLFGSIMMAIVIALRSLLPPADDQSVAVTICQMFITAAGFAALGAWFFRKRVTDAGGQKLGLRGSIRLSTLALSFVFALGTIALITVHVLYPHPVPQP